MPELFCSLASTRLSTLKLQLLQILIDASTEHGFASMSRELYDIEFTTLLGLLYCCLSRFKLDALRGS